MCITEYKKEMGKGTECLFKEIMKELSQYNKGHIYYTAKKLKSYPLRLLTSMITLATSIQHNTKSPSQRYQARERNKSHSNNKVKSTIISLCR